MDVPKRDVPVKFILGTDWWSDCDDALAIRLFSWAHKYKSIELLGVGINACMDVSVTSLDAFLRSEGLPDIPVGIDLDATDFYGTPSYQQRLSLLPSKYSCNDDAEDAVKLYRRLLQNSDSPVDIAEIGFPQILSNLLKSPADECSPLCGMDLVKQKVRKLWMMAGKWNDLENGKEHNFANNHRSRSAAKYLCDNWPVPITFLGFEISERVITGEGLSEDDVLYKILVDHGSPNGRFSWDPMLALLACINDEKEAGYSVVNGKASVVEKTGINHFSEDANGKHSYVIKDFSDDIYRNKINEILLSDKL